VHCRRCCVSNVNLSSVCHSLPPLSQEEKEATARRRAWRKLELDALELYAHMLKQCASEARPPTGKGKKAAAAVAALAAKRPRRDGGGGAGEAAGGSSAAAGASGAAAAAEQPTKEVLQAQVWARWRYCGGTVVAAPSVGTLLLVGPLLRLHSDPYPPASALSCPTVPALPCLLRLYAARGDPAAAGGVALRPAASGRRAGRWQAGGCCSCMLRMHALYTFT
jgi:hypothetical protein